MRKKVVVLPCPFCECEDVIVDSSSGKGFVECLNEKCYAIMWGRSESHALKMWNKRPKALDSSSKKKTTQKIWVVEMMCNEGNWWAASNAGRVLAFNNFYSAHKARREHYYHLKSVAPSVWTWQRIRVTEWTKNEPAN